ncbi:MAG: hypothetical protein WEA80_06955 [Gemmatimonadaceae bacterium]
MNAALGILVAVLVFSSPVAAQMAGLGAGSRVRVTSPRDDLNKHVGTVLEVRGDSVVIAGRHGSRTIALANVTRLDVSTGTRRHVGRGALIGLGVGALLGLTVVDEGVEDCTDEFLICPVPVSRAQMATAGALVSGAAGVVIGAIVGAFVKSDRWESRSAPFRAAINPGRSGGVQLSLSRKF